MSTAEAVHSVKCGALSTFLAHLRDYRAQSTAARVARQAGDAVAVARAAAKAGVALRRMRTAAAIHNGSN